MEATTLSLRWRQVYTDPRPWGEKVPEIIKGEYQVFVAVPIVAIIAAYFVLYYPPRYTLALWITLGSLIFIFKKPFVGVCFFYVLALARPQDIFWGLKDLRLSLMVAGVTLLSWVWERVKRSDWKIVITGQNILILCLCGQMVLSYLFAIVPEISKPHLIDFSKRFLFVFLTINTVKSFASYRSLCWVILGTVGILGLRGTYHYCILGYSFISFGGVESALDNNDFGLVLVMAFPFAYYMMFTERIRWKQLLSGIFIVGLLIAIMATFSRGAFLGLMVVCAGILLRAKKKLRALMLGSIFGLGVLVSLPADYYTEINSINTYEEDKSSMDRLHAWRAGWEMIKDYPYVGLGLGHFDYFSAKYMKRFLPAGERNMAAHNTYVELTAETGIPALILFLALLGFSLWDLKRIRDIAPRRSPLIHFSYMLELSIWGYMVCGFFLSSQGSEFIYILMAMAVALKGVVIQKHVLRTGPCKGPDEGYSWR